MTTRIGFLSRKFKVATRILVTSIIALSLRPGSVHAQSNVSAAKLSRCDLLKLQAQVKYVACLAKAQDKAIREKAFVPTYGLTTNFFPADDADGDPQIARQPEAILVVATGADGAKCATDLRRQIRTAEQRQKDCSLQSGAEGFLEYVGESLGVAYQRATLASLEPWVEQELDRFAATLEPVLPPPSELPARIRAYLEAHPEFFGSTVAVLAADGRVATSPYLYRVAGGLEAKDLVTPDYAIDQQAWLREPIDQRRPIWTAPYFDAGGGDIWMETRSVPLFANGLVIGVVTTDLPTEAPLPALPPPGP